MPTATNLVHRRVAYAVVQSKSQPDLITLGLDDWHHMFGSYEARTRDDYAMRGMYWVPRRKARPIRSTYNIRDSIPAFMYRGIPVVIADEYNALMEGHQSKRNVLTV